MMKERGADPEAETAAIDVTYEIYLVGRDDPVSVNATFELRRDLMRTGHEVEDFQEQAINYALRTIDIVREHRLILSDRFYNKFIFKTDELQAVSILAPSPENLIRMLEE